MAKDIAKSAKAKKKSSKKSVDNDEPSRPLRLEYIDAAQLDENPENWRTHPQSQIDAIKGVMVA